MQLPITNIILKKSSLGTVYVGYPPPREGVDGIPINVLTLEASIPITWMPN